MARTALELALRGAGGEPVDLRRTIASHGVADLPPNRIDEEAWTLDLTLPVARGRPRRVRVSPGRKGHAKLEVAGPAGAKVVEELRRGVAHVLRLDEDLSGFYEVAAADPELAWVTSGAGRMIRSPTVFEEVVKTICTTNCAWSATVRMVTALVEHLGEPAAGAADGPFGRAFPTPEAMARKSSAFYTETVRAGYRGAYLRDIAKATASGELDLEAFGTATPEELPDDELAAELLALPGVGPYAAAHVMLLLGRYSPLILDSWTRPKYLRVSGARRAKDSTIERRFRRYGPYAGLAFWLYLTRDWVEE